MEKSEMKFHRWFCYSHYSLAGAPKLEQAVFDYARQKMYGYLIDEEDLPILVAALKAKKRDLMDENRRLKDVEIRIDNGYWEDQKKLYIGGSTLSFMFCNGLMKFSKVYGSD